MDLSFLIKKIKTIKKGEAICQWDPFNGVIVSEFGGKVKFDNLEQGMNLPSRNR